MYKEYKEGEINKKSLNMIKDGCDTIYYNISGWSFSKKFYRIC
jgi:hypothetical protein